MKEPEVTLKLAIEHGLNEEEYNRILSPINIDLNIIEIFLNLVFK